MTNRFWPLTRPEAATTTAAAAAAIVFSTHHPFFYFLDIMYFFVCVCVCVFPPIHFDVCVTNRFRAIPLI